MIEEYLPHIFGMILIGIVIFISGFKQIRMKRLIENIPTSKIRSMAIGFVEVYGEAIPKNKPLISPLSKKDCIYYELLIEECRGSGKNRRWVTTLSDKSYEEFYIKDDTGKVLINPPGAELELNIDRKASSNFGRDPPKDIIEFLNSKKISYEGIFGINKEMRYTETYIAPKDKIYVMGTATLNNSTNKSKENDKIIITKSDGKEPFYISDNSEKELLKKFDNNIFLRMYGGIGLIILGIVLFLM